MVRGKEEKMDALKARANFENSNFLISEMSAEIGIWIIKNCMKKSLLGFADHNFVFNQFYTEKYGFFHELPNKIKLKIQKIVVRCLERNNYNIELPMSKYAGQKNAKADYTILRIRWDNAENNQEVGLL